MNLGKHFTLEEMTVTSTGLANIPGQVERNNLAYLVKNILDPVRELLGKPIHVNSGYRSPAVNAATPNSATKSQHMTGEAADLDNGDGNALLFKLIRDHFEFDQLIWEHGTDQNPAWVHVSIKTHGNRGEVLKTVGTKYIRI
jgi:hypothetical protein